MGKRLFLAACHGYLSRVFLMRYLFGKIKFLLLLHYPAHAQLLSQTINVFSEINRPHYIIYILAYEKVAAPCRVTTAS